MIPMRGRMIHPLSGKTQLQPYGQRPEEVIYSVSRADLNRVLIEEAARHPRVRLRFRQTCLAVLLEAGAVRFRNEDTGSDCTVPIAPTFAADGAGSTVRSSLARSGLIGVREDRLDHDYKELTIPASGDGRHVMEPHALHIWPRGGFMLIALPNSDGSFTATLFLARSGAGSFDTLTSPDRIATFFDSNSRTRLDSCRISSRNSRLTLRGSSAPCTRNPGTSAANCCSSVTLPTPSFPSTARASMRLRGLSPSSTACCAIRQPTNWRGETHCCSISSATAVPDTDAIAAMALENYHEMRDTVRDAAFLRRQALSATLERTSRTASSRATPW